MEFQNPYFLLLSIFLIIGIIINENFKDKKNLKLNFPSNIKSFSTLKLKLFDILPLYLRILLLLLIIIALARPQKVDREKLPPNEGIDIMLTIDTSLSMGAMDFSPDNRLTAAKKTAINFIEKRPYDKIGLVVFGGVAVLNCPLTLDHESLIDYISQINLNMTDEDGTAIGDAIATSVNHLKDAKGKSKIIILLTDGRSNTGVIQDLETASKLAKQFNIKIYSIGVAKKGKAKIPTGNPINPYIYIEDDLNETDLAMIAKITDGEFYRAQNIKELENIYSQIDSMEKTKFENKVNIQKTDLYYYFLIPAFFILIIIILLEKTYFLTIP